MIEFFSFLGAFVAVAYIGYPALIVFSMMAAIYLSLVLYSFKIKNDNLNHLIKKVTPVFGSIFWFVICLGIVYITQKYPLEQESKDIIVRIVQIFGCLFVASLIAMPFILKMLDKILGHK